MDQYSWLFFALWESRIQTRSSHRGNEDDGVFTRIRLLARHSASLCIFHRFRPDKAYETARLADDTARLGQQLPLTTDAGELLKPTSQQVTTVHKVYNFYESRDKLIAIDLRAGTGMELRLR